MTNGAKWWKFDFHTHTPASHDYGKGPDQEELKALTPREVILNYMHNEIDCVAVTDHNSGKWIDVLKETLQEMDVEKPIGYRPLHIFPGVEISVHGGIHLLAIFDKGTTSEHVTKVLNLSRFGGEYGNTDDTTELTFTQVVEIILQNNGLAIPAHVDQEAGLFKAANGIALKKYLKCEGLLAMQVCDLNYEKPSAYKELKLNLTELAGSDSHRPEQVGNNYTWIKMDQPNIDALKLALHDGEDGVIHFGKNVQNPNDVNMRYYIKNIEIKKASKAGRGKSPLKIDLSPWLSTIIGGRGSGKSSILEFLRIVLNKEDELPKTLQPQFVEFKKVSSSRGQTGMLLDDTEIKIELVKDGREIALVWKNNAINEFEKQLDNNEWVDLGKTSNLSKRFPIRLYSQKQLYELTKNPDLLLQLIDNMLDKDKWEQTKIRLESDWLNSRRQIREFNNNLKRKTEYTLSLKDIDAKIKLFEEMGHSIVLKDFQNIKNVESALFNIKTEMMNEIEGIQSSVAKLKKMQIPSETKKLLDSASQNMIDVSLASWDDTITEYEKINKKLLESQELFTTTLDELPWNSEKEKKKTIYNDLVSKLSDAGESDPHSYEKLLLERSEIVKEIEKFADTQLLLEKEKINQTEIWKNVLQHEKQLRNLRQEVIDEWNRKNDDLKIILTELGNTKNAEETLRKGLRKEGITFARDICERDDNDKLQNGIIHDLYFTDDSDDIWKRRNLIVKQLTQSEYQAVGYTKKFKEHLKALATNSPEDLDKILIWFPEDLVSLKLKINGKEENIDVGSAGQRTAAMLSLLLSIDDTPLILDQPEDDLDTRRITDLIVKGLRKLKSKQQIIVVTHNPNIPVNGSAEMIIHLNFAGGMIQVNAAGALQDKQVRKAVCDVMEGGSEALSNRYYRIFKALE